LKIHHRCLLKQYHQQTTYLQKLPYLRRRESTLPTISRAVFAEEKWRLYSSAEILTYEVRIPSMKLSKPYRKISRSKKIRSFTEVFI